MSMIVEKIAVLTLALATAVVVSTAFAAVTPHGRQPAAITFAR